MAPLPRFGSDVARALQLAFVVLTTVACGGCSLVVEFDPSLLADAGPDAGVDASVDEEEDVSTGETVAPHLSHD